MISLKLKIIGITFSKPFFQKPKEAFRQYKENENDQNNYCESKFHITHFLHTQLSHTSSNEEIFKRRNVKNHASKNFHSHHESKKSKNQRLEDKETHGFLGEKDCTLLSFFKLLLHLQIWFLSPTFSLILPCTLMSLKSQNLPPKSLWTRDPLPPHTLTFFANLVSKFGD